MLFLPTGTLGTSGAGSTLGHFTDAPTLTNGFALDVAFHPSNYLNDVSVYWNAAPIAGRFAPFNLDDGVFHHAQVVIDTLAGGAYVTAILTPNVFGAPGAPLVVASNRRPHRVARAGG
jgi:hypothetical protein